MSDTQGKRSRKSFFRRIVGASTAFFASDWQEGLSFDWLFDLALKRVRVRLVVVGVRVRVVVVRVRVMYLSLFTVEGLHCNELKTTRTPSASAVNTKSR
jgi:hypothetical protein